jgi:2-keto-4-pentenoate hydratase
MTCEEIEAAARLLFEAREARRRLSRLPEAISPRTTDDAEAICEAFTKLLEQPFGGWKVGATDLIVPIKLGLERPFCGPIPARYVYDSGARVEWGDLLRPVVEAEIGMRLGRNLPPRAQAYTREEVADAIDTLHPGIEIPESRLTDDHPHGALGMVADLGYAGRYVAGAGIRDWRAIAKESFAARLLINGREVARGSAAKAFGHPLDGVVWLANHRSKRFGEGLRAGDIVSTGSLTGIHWTKAGDLVVADYGPLGTVTVTLAGLPAA